MHKYLPHYLSSVEIYKHFLSTLQGFITKLLKEIALGRSDITDIGVTVDFNFYGKYYLFALWVVGEAKVGLIYEEELAERRLKIGDIYRIPAGSAFYLMNAEEGQRLHIICSIDPSESLGLGFFQVRHYLSNLRNILSLNLEGSGQHNFVPGGLF